MCVYGGGGCPYKGTHECATTGEGAHHLSVLLLERVPII